MSIYFDKYSKTYKHIENERIYKDGYLFSVKNTCIHCKEDMFFYWNTLEEIKEKRKNGWVCEKCNMPQMEKGVVLTST